jgi:hypothetical protein
VPKPADITAVKQRAYEAIRAAVSSALTGGEGPGADGGKETADRPPNRADLEAAGQGGFLSSLKPSAADRFAKWTAENHIFRD